MQSFKQWRMLNESLFPLGLSNTPTVSPIVSQFQFDEKKKNMDKNPEMEDDEDYDDEDDDVEDDDADDEDDGGDEGDDKGDAPVFKKGDEGDDKGFPAFMKKKGMKKKMGKKGMKKEAANPQADFLQSFNTYTAPENQMTSDDAWWQSVAGHASNPNQKYSDGFSEYMEDYLIDPNAQANFVKGNGQQVQQAPEQDANPGDIGYAPQGRIGGSFFGSHV